MNDLKKLAAEMRKRADVLAHHGYRRAADEQRDDADALDVYAGAQGSAARPKHGAIVETGCPACERALAAQEPVAWVQRNDFYSSYTDQKPSTNGWELLYAAPPLPSVSVSRSALVSAYSELFNNDDPTALRALGINVEDGK